MKTVFIRNIASLAIGALLLPTAANAQPTSFTATGQVISAPSPGIVCTNALGQVFVRGIIHVEREQGSDPRVTGQVLSIGDGAFNADGTASLQGTAHFQVGGWDATGTNFIPSGGVWEATWRGVMRADFSGIYSIVGYGVGGTIDGWRLEQALTVTNALGPFEATYLYGGTINPPSVTTRVQLDDFSDNRFTWPVAGAGGDGTFIVSETNRQLTIGGSWKSPTTKIADTCVWAFPARSWAVQNGRTLEARVDLVSLSSAATFAMVSLYHTWQQGYDFSLADGWVAIWKDNIPRVTCLYAEKVATRNTNVVLILGLTPVGQNTILTGKVLDKETGAVLYEKSVVDTPASDPSLSAQQLADLSGCRVWQDVGADVAGATWNDGVSPVLYVVQDTDGTKPPATATFANFELCTHEVPQVSIARAAQISFPAPVGVNYTVEAAPTVRGPYLPVQELEMPGIQKLTVPFSGPAQFFRLQQAP